MSGKEKSNTQLVLDKSHNFKLIVKKSLEDKIRYLCATFPNNEYSGALFYKVSGSVTNKDLVVECVDFCLCDIGTSTYTEFETKPEVVTYMCDNGLLDCYIGLLHSHNKMSTFFSGTDTDTLEAEGVSMPHFVSLIVNNNGDYTAAITSKITRLFRGTVDESMDTFGGGTESPTVSVQKSFSDVCIKYNYFDITVERDAWYTDIENKIADINKEKRASTKSILPNVSRINLPKQSEPIQLKMFDTDDADDDELEALYAVPDTEICEKVLKWALFMNTSRDVSSDTMINALHYFINYSRNKPDKVVEKEIHKAMVESIEEAVNGKIDSIEALNLCNDLTTYIDEFSYTVKDRILSDSIEDVLTLLFDTIIDIMEC